MPSERQAEAIEQHRFYAEELTWSFGGDPAMQCPGCEYNAVQVDTLLTRGFAECHQCGEEFSAEVVVE